jgi:hypothetical protein
MIQGKNFLATYLNHYNNLMIFKDSKNFIPNFGICFQKNIQFVTKTISKLHKFAKNIAPHVPLRFSKMVVTIDVM